MENYLYLLELFVDTITFSSNLPEYPRPQDVSISGNVGNFLQLDVSSIKSYSEENEEHKNLNLNTGKSILFSCNPDDLLQKINENPFVIHLCIKKKNTASADVGWTKDFYSLIKQYPENNGVLGPVCMQDQFLLNELETNRIMGDIKASVRLSSFGSNIQTSFQLISSAVDRQKKFLVRGARGETTFECQKIGTGHSGEALPLTPILARGNAVENSTSAASANDDEQVSWMALFKSSLDPKFSSTPDEFNIAISSLFHPKTPSNLTFDIVSLRERPEENKYIDLRIRGGSQGIIFEFDRSGQLNAPMTEDSSMVTEIELGEEGEEKKTPLTAEAISRMLCKNKDCPAVKKFKQLGIGPLATTSGLGGMYTQPSSLPNTYALSQTYGIFDEYGPYGLFSKPKRPEMPFERKTEPMDWAATCWRPKRRRKEKENPKCPDRRYCKTCSCYTDPLRLTGGGAPEPQDFQDILWECKEILNQVDDVVVKFKTILNLRDKNSTNSSNSSCKLKENQKDKNGAFQNFDEEPLRLTGGGVLDMNDVKSPLHECKEIMDQLDDVVAKYKKALGPCGKVTCPFAPNVTKESCKNLCKHDMAVYSESTIFTSGKEESEPETPKKKKFKLKGACGSNKCAYAQYKIGLTDEDAEMELQYLPHAPSGQCGHPKCPHPVDPILPPIHWDCPDPLPKGKCRNPNCPYLPKEIKCLNEILNKGPCGNFNCPFAPPPPCQSPYCPFANKECPYKHEGSDADSVCSNSDCPLGLGPNQRGRRGRGRGRGGSSYRGGTDGTTTPTCPYSMPCAIPMCATPMDLLAYIAMMNGQQPCYGGPNCPYEQNDDQSDCCRKKEPVCSSPTCPYQEKPTCSKKPSPCAIPVETPCGNPNCPHEKTEQQTANSCDHQSENEVCENAECPYAPKTCYKKPSPCYMPSENGDVCENPTCPYLTPSCPGTPASCPMPPPPLCIDPWQALLAYCTPISICPDGVCPYPSNNNALQICFGGPECPLKMPPPCGKSAPCEPPPCGKPATCEKPPPCGQPAPCCKPKEAKSNICENPVCPYAEGDVTEPECTKATCQSQGGNMFCLECPCVEGSGGGGAASEAGGEGGKEFPIEYTTGERTESFDNAPCTTKTCQSKGGKLVCDVCPCSGDATEKKRKKSSIKGGDGVKIKKKKGKRGRGKYVYAVGDKYPGIQIGHKECVLPAYNVPPKMGWLWNVHTPCLRLKPRRGWRPGAIAKTIAERIRKHREQQGLHMLELKSLRRGGRKGYGKYDSGTSINVQPKPTLHIKKQDGCYLITMNPLKDPKTLAENENPYMDCTPLQFKIVKNKDKTKTETECEEYRSCFCGDEDKEDSSDSELEIEFTPPAGIIHPERFKRKKNVVHCDTQYMAADFDSKSQKSKKSKKGKKGKKKGKGKKGKKGKGKKGKKKK